MKGLEQYLLPYAFVQVVSLIFLWVAWKNTRGARLLFAVLFFYAAIINMQLGLSNPDAYLDYAWMAIPLYRDFINGWFSHYHHIIIPAIAVGQACIGLGMLLHGWWVRWACIGAIVFLLAIAPLLVGSGFPFSLFVAVAAWLVLKHDAKWNIWEKPVVAFGGAD